MIVGEVKPSREAIIRVTARGPEETPLSIDAIVDTGFTDMLTLSPKLVRSLQLPFRGTMYYELADGVLEEFSLFVGQIQWNGRWREVVIAAANGEPLVGMGLMQDCRLTVDVIEGGRVEIRPLNE